MNSGSDILICDPHLFGKSCRGEVLCSTLDKIRRQKPKIRRLIIVGDWLHRNPPLDDPAYFERKYRKHPKHARALGIVRSIEEDGAEVIDIPGNHDPDNAEVQKRYPGVIPGRVVPIDEGYTWERAGKKHFAIHGHQGDPSMHHPGADFWLNVYDLIQSLDREDPEISRKIRRLATRKIWRERSRSVPIFAMERGRLIGANFAYWGHTHVIAQHVVGNGIVGYGIGSFCEHPASYVEVTDAGPKLHIVG